MESNHQPRACIAPLIRLIFRTKTLLPNSDAPPYMRFMSFPTILTSIKEGFETLRSAS